MFTVTESARARLYNILMGRGSGQLSLRLARGPSDRFGLVLDSEADGDQIIEYNGVKVLLIGEDIVPLVNGVTIDARSEDGSPILTLNRV